MKRLSLTFLPLILLACQAEVSESPPEPAAPAPGREGTPSAEATPAPDAPVTEVVIYTSHDQQLSEPILDLFEERTGISVRAVFDTEATKTTGLVNRLIAEGNRPRCDVFWNNEIVQTIRLTERGMTQPYASPNAEGIPAQFRDSSGHWTGFAARARVIAQNTEAIMIMRAWGHYEDTGMLQAIALPLFGTTATHFALLVERHGVEWGRNWLASLDEHGVQIFDSNGQVCDAVARGVVATGWTDTDDVAVAIAEGQPVQQIIPLAGAILIPNTVAMIQGAPHPDQARDLIDFLLSVEVETLLAEGSGKQIPLHPGVKTPDDVLNVGEITVQEIDWPAVAAVFDQAMVIVNEVLIRE
jgi:iron(III) transport system substrate-binding protein